MKKIFAFISMIFLLLINTSDVSAEVNSTVNARIKLTLFAR